MVINTAYGPNFKYMSGWEYMCIDVANYYGLDKKLFEERIQWVYNNIKDLESKVQDAETPELYHKAVMTLRRVQRGEAVGNITYWDGCCSGIQIMSALTGCEKGAYNTGCIDPEKRMDAYSNTTDAMNGVLKRKGLDSIQVPRSHIKQAVMTSGYGSKAVPKKVFGEGEMLDYFYEAAHIIAPGAFNLMDELLGSWRPYALEHVLELPDGFIAKMKVMETLETRIEVDELDHATFTMEYKENRGTEKGRANVANTIHCCDAYLLRELERLCNYNPELVAEVLKMLEARLLAHTMGMQAEEATGDMVRRIRLWNENKQSSMVILNDIDWSNYMQLPIDLARDVMRKVNFMLTYKPFPVATVHDAFGSHPNNCNEVRYWYKEMLAEFADSTILQSLMNQLYQTTDGVYTKLSENLGDKIRGSNYALS